MMMIEIDKRDVEIASLKEQLGLYESSTMSMAEALKSISEQLFRVSKYDDRDWSELKFILDKYGVVLDSSVMTYLSLAIPEFVRWKLGRTDEKPE
jgi:two-component sensor histidine kinase